MTRCHSLLKLKAKKQNVSHQRHISSKNPLVVSFVLTKMASDAKRKEPASRIFRTKSTT